ncbi:hypothetical protein N7472_008479 [Penicillium cf. griseofulvum]|uniref:Uncharacterized protein n=1 Tax=Penicillium cf. griseofulvum TaxID=2972120 RepID=A0A9W9J706_9EURO|nr:hypothetical protein N7472_008479 [Penicillium cf. griseofulvum]
MDGAYLSSSGWDTTSNSSGEGVDNAPQTTILYRSGGVNASQIIINLFSPRAGSNWRLAQTDNWDPCQPEPDENEVTAPEIPTHDEGFLSRGGTQWKLRPSGSSRVRGHMEALEATFEAIIAMGTPDEAAQGEGEGYDSDTPWVEEVEDIADEYRDGDEDASLDEA